MAEFLPWQRKLATTWLAETERFAHAWLIHGLPGIGKRSFALAAANALLCEQNRGGIACGQCQACRWMASGNHPDFRRVRPDAVAQAEGDVNEEAASATKSSPSKEIRVEQIRSLAGWFGTATHRGGWRVAVIYPAHAMNLYTANALLKVLEEPPPRTVFLLTAERQIACCPRSCRGAAVCRCRYRPKMMPSFGWRTKALKNRKHGYPPRAERPSARCNPPKMVAHHVQNGCRIFYWGSLQGRNRLITPPWRLPMPCPGWTPQFGSMPCRRPFSIYRSWKWALRPGTTHRKSP